MISLENIQWEDLFKEKGPIASNFPKFESRPQQIEMAKQVKEALDFSSPLLIEAGTGVGKSMGYLLPAALWAVQNDKKILVSTFTKALQAQLIEKDLPDIQKILKTIGMDISFSLLMGNENYLCMDRLMRHSQSPQNWLTSQEEQNEERGILQDLRRWASTSKTGIRNAIPFSVKNTLWKNICRERNLCLGQKSPFRNQCLYQKDLTRARKAQILVINHSLLFSGFPLKDFDVVVFDEAHTVENVAVQFLGYSISDHSLRILGDTIRHTWHDLHPENRRPVDQIHQETMAAGENLFQQVRKHFPLHASHKSLRLRSSLPFKNQLGASLQKFLSFFKEVLPESQSAEEEANLHSLMEKTHEYKTRLKGFFDEQEKGCVYWMEKGERSLSLHSSPIEVSGFLRQSLFETYSSVILTSATLATDQSFHHIQRQMGLEESMAKILDSPFNYKKQAALWVDKTVPDPKTHPHEFEKEILDRCLKIAESVPGGIFFLFTSWALLEKGYRHLKKKIKQRPLYKQGNGLPFDLIKKFKKARNGILFGTDTFWQGVDVPGDALSCVVITKLPFSPPTSPLEEARIEWLAQQGLDPFKEHTVPKAVMKFRQGFGRLIRTQKDHGAVVILDPRVETKSYGQSFLHALPPCKRMQSIEDLKLFFKEYLAVPQESEEFSEKNKSNGGENEAIMEFIKAWNGKLPRSSIANVLRGGKSSDVFKKHPPEKFTSFYGILKGTPYHQIMKVINSLIDEDHLLLENGKVCLPQQKNGRLFS